MKSIRSSILTLSLVASFVFAGTASANDWQFGVSLGLQALNMEGDIGLGTLAGGSVETDFDLDYDDIDNAMEDAFGLSGFAQKGQGKINFAFGVMELVGEADSDLPLLGTNLASELSWKKSVADVNFEYLFENSPFSMYAGLRYTEHEIDLEVTLGMLTIGREIEEDWVDFYVGLGYALPIAENIVWSTKVDAGAGGSDGSYTVKTGLNWRFCEQWIASFNGKWYSVDFENGSKGDPDWYVYNAEEFGLGLAITYTW